MSARFNNSKIQESILKKKIEARNLLLERRLSSDFHKQWDKADSDANTLSALGEELMSLMKEEEDSRKQFKKENRDYMYVLEAFGIVVLSVLLEVSAFGLISLQQTLSLNDADRSGYSKEWDYDAAMKLLYQDVKLGKCPPVLRTIRSLGYGLKLDKIRQVLRDLHKDGVILPATRGSFRLLDRDQASKLS
ncbi:hypothetical protein [uncultured Pseudoteredinibacter sp.]|uniref:hypothetical protein n=1 Tax=uncultured Pseudoteredinibacter sp. TaxID=1641701 RepID=UPI002627D78E|nr:hypothetical protein [uncultured Pseudoteredinibacter sp.]